MPFHWIVKKFINLFWFSQYLIFFQKIIYYFETNELHNYCHGFWFWLSHFDGFNFSCAQVLLLHGEDGII